MWKATLHIARAPLRPTEVLIASLRSKRGAEPCLGAEVVHEQLAPWAIEGRAECLVT